ncbi:FAD-dependent oxidoreductase [Shewanella surugensis]|uniref:FAD-dependent oxidoreductase n=1 Tax=Shewanella surugensis TaxID=212020 RepID=A0ABT0L910_9GAMM|nr:FAD-dependent oxidoreductase [Shewanella surugensis]MCL1123837.1 FAD-dependent oxidoreductase [Shewanella surugensis]
MQGIDIQHDVVIIGGGMVGAASAVGLAQLGINVAVLEMSEPKAYQPEQPLDLRVSAISAHSEKLLNSLGAMDFLNQARKVAYKGLETWEIDGFITRFHSDQIGESHLGHIIENRLIQLALWQQLHALDNIHLYCPVKVVALSRQTTAHQASLLSSDQTAPSTSSVRVQLEDGRTLTAPLLVGADGANSFVRQWANIGVSGWDYAQSAMLINIKTAQAEPPVTWQQFTPHGPRSLLPLPDNHASLVWYDDTQKIKQLSQLNNKALGIQIRAHFPRRLAQDFEVLDKGCFSLTRRHAQRYFSDNVVILGDAAHTINPLAGQGVNLGFKDVAALIESVRQRMSESDAWWDNTMLAHYQSSRYRDNQLMMSAMDMFYAGFSNELLPLKLIRNGMLKLANINGPIKRKVLKYAMGY